MKKALRKQIKQDELASGYASAGAWLHTHVEQVKIGLIGAAVLAVAAGGLLYFHSQRTRDSQRAFDEAHDLFSGAIGKPEEGAVAASKEEKYQKALAAFHGVAERYGSLAVGRRARYYAALCDIELGHRDKAAGALRELTEKQKAGAAGTELAELVLARLECMPGKYDQAISRYRQILDRRASVLPRDYVLMRLAEAFQEAGRLADAAATFSRVVDEMPASPFAEDARGRAEYLKLAATKQG